MVKALKNLRKILCTFIQKYNLDKKYRISYNSKVDIKIIT